MTKKETQRSPITPAYGTIRDAAAYLGTSPRTIRRLIQNDGLPAYQLGPKGRARIRFSDIDEFMERYRIDRVDIDKIVDEVLTSLKEKAK